MTSSIGNYHPAFIIAQEPNRFGNKQDDYLARANEAIHQASEKIKLCRQNKGDFKKLFFELIEEFSRERSAIAKDHGTKKAEDFGVRRDKYKIPGSLALEVLGGVYKKYNEKTLSLFSKYLKEMELREAPGQFKKEYEIQSQCRGRLSKLRIEILDREDLENKGYANDLINYFPDYIPLKEMMNPSFNWTETKTQECRQKFLRFKNEFPEVYQQRKVVHAITSFREKWCPVPFNYFSETTHPYAKSLYVFATLRAEVDKKLYQLTHYITFMWNRDWLERHEPEEHPIARMNRHSQVMLMHQDEFIIQKTLEETAKLFEEACLWGVPESFQELIDRVALVCHYATHNMRDFRGTAAENEWLEQAIYASYDLQVTHHPDQMLDLEAYAHPLLADFIEVYRNMVQLK